MAPTDINLSSSAAAPLTDGALLPVRRLSNATTLQDKNVSVIFTGFLAIDTWCSFWRSPKTMDAVHNDIKIHKSGSASICEVYLCYSAAELHHSQCTKWVKTMSAVGTRRYRPLSLHSQLKLHTIRYDTTGYPTDCIPCKRRLKTTAAPRQGCDSKWYHISR